MCLSVLSGGMRMSAHADTNTHIQEEKEAKDIMYNVTQMFTVHGTGPGQDGKYLYVCVYVCMYVCMYVRMYA